VRTIETPDEPRTPAERWADFAIGAIVGAVIAGGVFLLSLRRRAWLIDSLGVWFLVLALLVVLGCGYLNYRLGAALWSRM
jgi:hypothetical protein